MENGINLTTILLSVCGFFLVGMFLEIKEMGRNIKSLLIKDAKRDEQITGLEKRIENIERLN